MPDYRHMQQQQDARLQRIIADLEKPCDTLDPVALQDRVRVLSGAVAYLMQREMSLTETVAKLLDALTTQAGAVPNRY